MDDPPSWTGESETRREANCEGASPTPPAGDTDVRCEFCRIGVPRFGAGVIDISSKGVAGILKFKGVNPSILFCAAGRGTVGNSSGLVWVAEMLDDVWLL